MGFSVVQAFACLIYALVLCADSTEAHNKYDIRAYDSIQNSLHSVSSQNTTQTPSLYPSWSIQSATWLFQHFHQIAWPDNDNSVH